MRKIRVTGRFYVFLAMLAVGLFFIAREFYSFGVSEALITEGSSTYSRTMDAVIVRDEVVASSEGDGRIEYLVEEGAQVTKGQAVVDLYTAKYAVDAFDNLEKVRADIRNYYQKVLGSIIDPDLDRLEANVQNQALELKRMVQNRSVGNLVNVESALRQSMDERYVHLKNNRREEAKLNDYYNQESRMLNSIESWKTTKKADIDGVVSFYLDGYERALTIDALSDITPEQVRAVVAGKPLTAEKTANARLTKDVFKVSATGKWYVLLISSEPGWNPVQGQVYQMQMEGVSGYAFMGTVAAIQKSQGEVIAQVEVASAIGPMISRRSGRMNIGAVLTGFTVPNKAIANQNGQTGIWLSDAVGGTFVPVEVLVIDDAYALIQPLVEGTLRIGQRVQLQ